MANAYVFDLLTIDDDNGRKLETVPKLQQVEATSAASINAQLPAFCKSNPEVFNQCKTVVILKVHPNDSGTWSYN